MAKKAKAVSAAKKSAPKPKLAATKKSASTKKAVSNKTSVPAKKVAVATKATLTKEPAPGQLKAAPKITPKVAPKAAKALPATEMAETPQVNEKSSVTEVEKPEKAPVPKKTKMTRAAEAKEKAAKQASSDEEARWVDIYEKNKGEKPLDYDMKRQYESNKPLQHKILGWGWILSNENDRLEVLFKDGKKILISNYNS